MWLGSPFRAFCASRFSPARRLQPATMHLCGGFVGRQLFRYFARPAQRDSPEPLMYDVRFIRKDGQRVDAALSANASLSPRLSPVRVRSARPETGMTCFSEPLRTPTD